MVAGPVASGKSNLLKSILGELTIRFGRCNVPEFKAYVPQTPWTALGTVKDNIVFGKEYDDDLYHQVRYLSFGFNVTPLRHSHPYIFCFASLGHSCMCLGT